MKDLKEFGVYMLVCLVMYYDVVGEWKYSS